MRGPTLAMKFLYSGGCFYNPWLKIRMMFMGGLGACPNDISEVLTEYFRHFYYVTEAATYMQSLKEITILLLGIPARSLNFGDMALCVPK